MSATGRFFGVLWVLWSMAAASAAPVRGLPEGVRAWSEHDADSVSTLGGDPTGLRNRTKYDYEPRNLLTRVDFPGALATNYFYFNGVGERVRKDDAGSGKVYTWDGIDQVVVKSRAAGATGIRLVKGYTPVSGSGVNGFPTSCSQTWRRPNRSK